MRLTPDIGLIGGGNFGFNLSADLDCHVYLIDGGDDLALVDAGTGGTISGTEQMLANLKQDGYPIDRISTLILTHYHADHAGAAAEWHELLGVEVVASPLAAKAVTEGDEEIISLAFAKQAGFYPVDYRFLPCPTEGSLVERNSFSVGRLTVTPFDTPGHSAGHMSFLVSGGDRSYFIGGDLVFYGGTIIAQNIPDCSIQEYSASVLKVAELDFDAHLPGHLAISLSNGKRHVDMAASQFRQLMIPRNAV